MFGATVGVVAPACLSSSLVNSHSYCQVFVLTPNVMPFHYHITARLQVQARARENGARVAGGSGTTRRLADVPASGAAAECRVITHPKLGRFTYHRRLTV